MPKFYRKEPTLNFIPLGGIGTVTKNMYLYEYADEILIVDCGIGFPEIEQLGVDVVVPDISYLHGKSHRIKGIVITHGHEDHFGALPYLLSELDRPPIYSTKLVRGLIQAKLDEFNLLRGHSLRLIEDTKQPLQLGKHFSITPFHVNHSIPEALGLSIRTPLGQIIHAADFKFDWTPVDQKQFEIAKLTQLAKRGVLCLMSDCLGATTPGYTASEKDIQEAFEREIQKDVQQVFITTVSSNISRIQQAINASVKYRRKVCFLGRSIDQNVQVAERLGFLKIPKDTLVSSEKASHLKSVTYLIAGCYGQTNSALSKLSEDTNRFVKLRKEAIVIFSADPIPGVYDKINSVIDKLTNRGARVIYSEIQEGLHTSGHGSQGDLMMMIALTNPQYFVPIGGNPRHMRAYREMAISMGYSRTSIFELQNGQTLQFTPGKANLGKEVKTQDIFVDGSRIGDVGTIVLQDRQILSQEGIFVVIIKKRKDRTLSPSVDIVSRGFVYMAAAEKLISDATLLVQKEIKGKSADEWPKAKKVIEDKLSRFLFRITSREPMIIPVIVEI